jgi:hypothetical protein
MGLYKLRGSNPVFPTFFVSFYVKSLQIQSVCRLFRSPLWHSISKKVKVFVSCPVSNIAPISPTHGMLRNCLVNNFLNSRIRFNSHI